MRDRKINEQLKHTNEQLKIISNILENSTIARPKKSIPYNSTKQISTITTTTPSSPDGYTVIEDIYANNNMRPIPVMELGNDGPGTLYCIIASSSKEGFGPEERLNVGDIRKLFNVYEIRLRTDVPLTRYRLVEWEIITGSFARAYKANTEIRPTLQDNEKIKAFICSSDVSPALIPIVPPIPAVYLGPSFHAPIAAGATIQLTDIETFVNMPYIIPEGYILETFSCLAAFTRDWTLKGYYELTPGTGVYNLAFTLPSSVRGSIQWILNVNVISTAVVDPTGAPVGGRGILFTITNDDAVNTMIGEIDIIMILRKVR